MIRRQWISYLFSFAFAIALAHHIIPHSHPNHKPEDSTHHAKDSTPHTDHRHPHKHAHGEDSNHSLPLFTHFSNGDFIASAKYSFFSEKQRVILEFEELLPVSMTLPVLPGPPAPTPHARDLPQGFLLTIQSLRAPPVHLS